MIGTYPILTAIGYLASLSKGQTSLCLRSCGLAAYAVNHLAQLSSRCQANDSACDRLWAPRRWSGGGPSACALLIIVRMTPSTSNVISVGHAVPPSPLVDASTVWSCPGRRLHSQYAPKLASPLDTGGANPRRRKLSVLSLNSTPLARVGPALLRRRSCCAYEVCLQRYVIDYRPLSPNVSVLRLRYAVR